MTFLVSFLPIQVMIQAGWPHTLRNTSSDSLAAKGEQVPPSHRQETLEFSGSFKKVKVFLRLRELPQNIHFLNIPWLSFSILSETQEAYLSSHRLP